jgi:hypothetical protein
MVVDQEGAFSRRSEDDLYRPVERAIVEDPPEQCRIPP